MADRKRPEGWQAIDNHGRCQASKRTGALANGDPVKRFPVEAIEAAVVGIA